MVDDQHLGRVPFLLQIKPEFLDSRKDSGPAHSSVELLLHHPIQAQIVRAGKTCVVDDGTVAEVSGCERLQLLRQLRGGDIVAIGCRSDLPTDHAGAARLATVIGRGSVQFWCTLANSEYIGLHGAGFMMQLQSEAVFQELLKHLWDLAFLGVAGYFRSA